MREPLFKRERTDDLRSYIPYKLYFNSKRNKELVAGAIIF
ncbi:hypothetical protein GCM10011501_35390 [Thalassotalea profundi]|uniref:Uncharacterized protein n=1 Tax=Thalassotalea profundi TaxID=2036687 RepID=A0ABQ3J7P9_9GAMM|nr:hypothetical protein GCM10011501_35390 [Thalassotalea profundi]